MSLKDGEDVLRVSRMMFRVVWGLSDAVAGLWIKSERKSK